MHIVLLQCTGTVQCMPSNLIIIYNCHLCGFIFYSEMIEFNANYYYNWVVFASCVPQQVFRILISRVGEHVSFVQVSVTATTGEWVMQ